jgi:hypothetical protein
VLDNVRCFVSKYVNSHTKPSFITKIFFLGLHHHYAACLKTIHKTEAFVMDHRLTVPEQKLCGKDIKVNPFLILCDTFRQKDSLVEINDGEKCLVHILLFSQQHRTRFLTFR